MLGEDGWVAKASRVLERLGPTAAKAPLAFGRLLAALDFELGRPVELAVIGGLSEPGTHRLLEVARSRYLPNRLLAVAPPDGNGRDIPLLADREARGGAPTAYLCQGFVCQAPTSDAAELTQQLERFSAA